MRIKKWTYIEDCPKDNFLAVLKLGRKIRIRKVYVHVDNHFLAWRDLRTMDKMSVGNWKCIFYIAW